MNIRLNIILATLAAVLAGWYYSQQSNGTGLSQLIKKEGSAEYIGQKISASAYDLNGKPQYFAQAAFHLNHKHLQKSFALYTL
ncbi:LPS export ABC transporter periplasmic protein LptC, partial [Glaesserella parasuis]|nr:LPS export ABC transporter periplasmic protein LptC [Glaesserella parasuis]